MYVYVCLVLPTLTLVQHKAAIGTHMHLSCLVSFKRNKDTRPTGVLKNRNTYKCIFVCKMWISLHVPLICIVVNKFKRI